MNEPDFSKLKEKIAKTQKSFACPHCSQDIPVVLAAKAAEETTLSFVVTVAEGHLLSAGSLGSMLVNLEKIMKSLSIDMGGICLTLIKGISQEGVTTTVDFLIVQPSSALYKQNSPKKSARRSK